MSSGANVEGIQRRTFLSLSIGGAFGGATGLLSGCGDDGAPTLETESGTGSTGTGPSTTAAPTTAMTGDSTDPDGTGTSGTADTGTGDESSGETGEPIPECDHDDAEVIEWDPDAAPIDDANFPMAVMAGEMKPESVMLTVFVEDAAPRMLRVWQPTAEDGMVAVIHELEVTPNADGFVKVTVDGLCPGAWYRYGFFYEDFSARSWIGEFRTAIHEEAVEPLTLAVTACNGTPFGWPALDVMADEYFDMFIHLGDMAYNDGAETIEEYRASWLGYMSHEGFKNIFSRGGMYATWDDHEIDNNSNFDPRTMLPDQLQKRQNAMDSYFEMLPIDAEGPNYQLWRSFRWGRTAEIIVLDCRYERRASQGLYMSVEQMDWLKDRLLNSPCQFKVIMNSVPITNMPFAWDVAANDRWEGFPAQRDELMNFISENDIPNVWFLSGDFHVTFVSRLEPGGMATASRVREIAVTGGNTNPVPEIVLGMTPPQFDYGRTLARGCLLTFDPEADAVNVRLIDPDTGEDDYNETLTYA